MAATYKLNSAQPIADQLRGGDKGTSQPYVYRRRPQLAQNTFVEPDTAGRIPVPTSSSSRWNNQPKQNNFVLSNLAHNVNSLDKLHTTTQAVHPLGALNPTTSPVQTIRGGLGQQFAVASVGNNGMMYLRYV